MPQQRPEIFVQHGTLFVHADSRKFERIREAVVEQAGADACLVESTDLRGISIVNADTIPPAIESRFRDRVALVGCAAIGFVILFTFIAGVMALLGLK